MDTAAQILRKLLCQRYEFNSQYNDDTRYSADSKFNLAVSAFAAQLACAEGKSGESHIFDDSSFKAQLFNSYIKRGIEATPDNGYHNKTHAKSVVASMALILESYANKTLGVEFIVPGLVSNSAIHTASYLVAAAFHDAGHSGGTKPDAQNIEAALNAYVESGVASSAHEHWPELAIVPDMIISTEFKRSTYTENLTPFVLRDADLLGFLYKEHPEQLAGLAQEQGIPITSEREGIQFLREHYLFYKSLKMHSPAAIRLVNDYVDLLHYIVLPVTTKVRV